MQLRKTFLAAGLLAALASTAGCSTTAATSGSRAATAVRLGYFPNITHAPAIAGVSSGIFQRALGKTKLETSVFNAGPEAVNALFAGALDVAFVGPNPAINAFTRSNGEAVRVIAGTTSGGASLVVRPSIESVADLKGAKLATPQRGNTQDVALRSWLSSQGFSSTLSGAGDVSVVSQDSSQTLETFRSGAIDGAWVPEPWASRLVIEGNGRVLVDESSLWPQGKYVTTLLVVRAAFLRQNREIVRRVLEGLVQALEFVNQDRVRAKVVVGDAVVKLVGKRLRPEVEDRAWSTLTFTADPLIASLRRSAGNAVKLRLLKNGSLSGIEDLAILNAVLKATRKPEIQT